MDVTYELAKFAIAAIMQFRNSNAQAISTVVYQISEFEKRLDQVKNNPILLHETSKECLIVCSAVQGLLKLHAKDQEVNMLQQQLMDISFMHLFCNSAVTQTIADRVMFKVLEVLLKDTNNFVKGNCARLRPESAKEFIEIYHEMDREFRTKLINHRPTKEILEGVASKLHAMNYAADLCYGPIREVFDEVVVISRFY